MPFFFVQAGLVGGGLASAIERLPGEYRGGVWFGFGVWL